MIAVCSFTSQTFWWVVGEFRTSLQAYFMEIFPILSEKKILNIVLGNFMLQTFIKNMFPNIIYLLKMRLVKSLSVLTLA